MKFLARYLAHFYVPKIDELQAVYLANEISKMVEIMLAEPDIEYEELYDRVHKVHK